VKQPDIADDASGSSASLLGRVLDGRYRIDALLGEGGLGQVFRATDRRLSRSVAIKVMHGQHVARAELRARFEREARSLAALSHPNVVGVIDYGVDGDVPFLVMDLLEGRTLEAALAEGLPVARALPIVRDVLRAVAYAHAQGFVHRDLKPANVFLQAVPEIGDVVRVLDFGLAKLIDEAPSGPTLTRAGMVLGTPAYMSPEQATGGEVDARADVYALGIVLFELVTGTRPFQATDGPDLLRQHLLTAIPPMNGLRSGCEVGPELQALVARAAAKSRVERFKDGAEMAAALDALPAGALRFVGKGLAAAPVSAGKSARRSTPELDATMASDAGATLASQPSEPPGRAPVATIGPARARPSSSRGASSSLRAKLGIGIIALLMIAGLGIWSFRGPPETERASGLPVQDPVVGVDAPPEAAGTHTEPTPERPARGPDAPTPPQLASIESRIRAGRTITDEQRRTLFRYSTNHPHDPRAWLLMGHADFLAGARTDACNRYERAFHADEAARDDETMRHDLLVMSAHRTVGPAASRLVVSIYGARALPHLAAVEQELAGDRDAARRLRTLRRRLEHPD
jgi:eukaryotic-like serine/threonine-protein kinase